MASAGVVVDDVRLGMLVMDLLAQPEEVVLSVVERATQMRQGNFAIAGHPNLDCYITVLGGGGGGLLANVNREALGGAAIQLNTNESFEAAK